MLRPIIRFFTEEDGWLHLEVILIAFLFCLVMHIIQCRKGGDQ
ncbi:MAG: hypothetical protein V1876_00685 [Candidatus Peregrinibacteria bacterium]